MTNANRALQVGALFVLFAICPLGYGSEVEVARVLDGDSLVLTDGREVRLLGINAPEFNKNNGPNEPMAEAARDQLWALVRKKIFNLKTEQEVKDRYGRLLAHLLQPDGKTISEIMVREGYAWMVAIPPNIGRLEQLQLAEAKARAENRGVWAVAAYRARPAEQLTMRDTGFRRVTGRVTRVGESAHAVYMDLGPTLTIVIPQADWRRWFRADAKQWEGRQLEARGWVTQRGERLRLRVHHPAMLTSTRLD